MITTKNLNLMAWSDKDAEAFYELSQDDGLTLFPINRYRQESVESARSWIQEKSRGKYGVWEKASGKLIGLGGLTPWVCDGEELVDITYRLITSAWGKGLGIELALGLVNHAFEVQGLNQVTATITPDNIASQKLAAKLGMTFSKHIELLGVPTDVYRLHKK